MDSGAGPATSAARKQSAGGCSGAPRRGRVGRVQASPRTAKVNIRTAAIVVSLFDAGGWAFVAVATFLSRSDPATKGLDNAAGLAATVLLLVTAVPPLVLALVRRAPRLALTRRSPVLWPSLSYSLRRLWRSLECVEAFPAAGPPETRRSGSHCRRFPPLRRRAGAVIGAGATTQCKNRQSGAVLYRELPIDVVQVNFDRPFGEIELVGDLFV